jgi:DNA-directed RNA polymerase subunit alpha
MVENNLRDFFLGCKECILENPRNFYGSFTLGPFQNSQSLTIANALRRTLLTEIQNIAITYVEIAGVFHEYSLIEGVRESVLDILLNFKGIVLKTSLAFEKPLFGYLNVRGPGIVRASDLKLPPNISCVDPDQYIATLSENGSLSLRLTISDFCHFSKEKTQLEDKRLLSQIEKNSNPLFIDPNFNPILKVSYIIENLEPINQKSRKSLMHFEIWTNGSIHPRKAFYFTFDFLKNILSKFDEMKYINKKVENSFFSSEEIFTKILKSYEYDFGFSEMLSSTKLSSPIQKQSAFLQENSFEEPFSFSKKEKGGDFLNIFHHKASNQFKYFSEGFEKGGENNHFDTFKRNEKEKILQLSIENLNLPFRIYYSLIQNKIFTIGDLLNLSLNKLQNFSGIGNFSISLIQKKLKKIGFCLKSEKENEK